MTKYNELVDIIRFLLNDKFMDKPELIKGLLGDGTGRVEVSGKPDYVYARFNRSSTTYFEVFNKAAPKVDGWPVLMGISIYQPGFFQVLDTDWDAYQQSGWGEDVSTSNPHGPTHEWRDQFIGADPVSIYTRSIAPGRAYSASPSGTVVYVNSFEYHTGTIWQGPGVDLQPAIASLATGTARFMGVYVSSSNTLGLVTGSLSVDTQAFDPPLVSFPFNSIPIARIRTYGNQIGIRESDFRDARRLWDLHFGSYPFSIITVDLVDPYADYTSIQTAINAASSGAIIKVGPGTYLENVTLNKAIALLGHESSKTIIRSSTPNTSTIDITASGATLRNLRVEHTASSGTNSVIKSSPTNVNINDCFLSASGAATENRGIYVVGGSIDIIDTIISLTSGTTKKGILSDTGFSLVEMYQGAINVSGGIAVEVNDALAFSSLYGVFTNGTISILSGVIFGNYSDLTGNLFLLSDSFIDVDERSTNPTTPGTDHWQIYAKSDGFYQISDTGQATKLVQSQPVGENLLYNSLTYGDTWQDIFTQNDITNDTYTAGVWNFVHNGQAPDVSRDGSDAGQSSAFNLQIEFDSASSQCGIVHFFDTDDTAPMRGTGTSLSLDAWGTNVTNIRGAIIYYTGTVDGSFTSDVVGTWQTGNPILAAGWIYANTPGSSQAISSTRNRFNLAQNVLIPTIANAVGVFLWTPDLEGSGDVLNIGRVKFEIGEECTNFNPRGSQAELADIQRYVYVPNSVPIYYGFRQGTQFIQLEINFPVIMRIAPTLAHNITAWNGAGTPGATEMSAFDYNTNAWITITGALTVTTVAAMNKATIIPTAATSFTGSGGDNVGGVLGADVLLQFSSRL